MKRPRHDQRQLRRRGFTLVEVVVTSTIAAMLVTSIIGLTVRLERQRLTLQTQYALRDQTGLLRQTIRADLLQSRLTVLDENGELTLIGLLATDDQGVGTSGFATVRYVVQDDRLIRFESRDNVVKEDILWVGATRLDVAMPWLGTLDASRVRVKLWNAKDERVLDMTTLLRSSLRVGGIR